MSSGPAGKSWYLAVLVVSSRVEGRPDKEPLVDLQYRLIRAADAEAAYLRARELGAEEVQDYENDAGERVFWEFDGLHELHEIGPDNLKDGAEVFYRMEEDDPQEWVVSKEELRAFRS
jgi:hypothetical protein